MAVLGLAEAVEELLHRTIPASGEVLSLSLPHHCVSVTKIRQQDLHILAGRALPQRGLELLHGRSPVPGRICRDSSPSSTRAHAALTAQH